MAALANPIQCYVGSDKYAAVTQWAALTITLVGTMVRQLAAPALGSERVFICIGAGTTGAAEPTWVITRRGKTTDATVTWQECTGQPAVNGDAVNTPDWNSAKSNTVALGQIIKRLSGASYQICTTAGTCGSGAEPAFSNTAGVTTADNTVTWTSLGVVGNFAAFAAPNSRILNADAAGWSFAGSPIYISNGHAETQASALTFVGGQSTAAAPCQYLCVSNAVAPPVALTTGATVSTTGAFALSVNTGFSYWYGVAFSAASGSSNGSFNICDSSTAAIALNFDNCSFRLNTTSASPSFRIGSKTTGATIGANLCSFNNCSFVYGATGQSMQLYSGMINFNGGSIALTGSSPTTAFVGNSGMGGIFTIRDCDLSGLSGNLFSVPVNNTDIFYLENCKLNAAATMTTGSYNSPGAAMVRIHNCNSGAVNYGFYQGDYSGTVQQDTATINAAGASNGTQGVSMKAVTSANAKYSFPLALPEIAQWQDTTGSSKTATIEIAGAATLTTADIWVELEYLGSSAAPLGSLVGATPDPLATPTNITTSTATWSGSPAAKQKLQVTFTPQMKGVVKARVFVAKASATVYVDPLITIT